MGQVGDIYVKKLCREDKLGNKEENKPESVEFEQDEPERKRAIRSHLGNSEGMEQVGEMPGAKEEGLY